MGDWIPDHKKTSSYFLSQIHVCRFFYKLIDKKNLTTSKTIASRRPTAASKTTNYCE